MLRWEKRFIAGEAFESAAFVDVDQDGVLDIVSGAFWYQGPDFERRRTVADVRRVGDYYDDFGAVAIDVNGSGVPDIVTGGWWGETLRWRENPGATDWPAGNDVPWQERTIAEIGSIEQPRAWDVDGDGELELVPNTPNGPLQVIKLIRGPEPAWQVDRIWDGQQGHGLGFGDISGSGRGDFVMNHGWVESMADGSWVYHPEFQLCQTSSVPIIVADVDGDGLSDLLVGNGHGYGIHWWRQSKDGDKRTWTRHPIDEGVSQCHTIHWVDIDGDGDPELVTGKRWRAHVVGDEGNADDLGIWYYDWNGSTFDKHVIDSGPAGFGSGVGLDFDVADVTGNGYPDIVAPGKDGLWLLVNLGSD